MEILYLVRDIAVGDESQVLKVHDFSRAEKGMKDIGLQPLRKREFRARGCEE
jgi:hypothetical protein